MYECYYNSLKPKWKDDIELAYMDTDSYILNIKTEDLYEDILNDEELKKEFDFSDYNKDHPLYSTINTKVPGKFKDELNGKILTEWIAIRSKCYSYNIFDKGKTILKNKNKGIQKEVSNKNMNMNLFKECLFKDKDNFQQVRRFNSDKHNMQIITTNKLALHKFDQKRFICEDGIKTLPFGTERSSVQVNFILFIKFYLFYFFQFLKIFYFQLFFL